MLHGSLCATPRPPQSAVSLNQSDLQCARAVNCRSCVQEGRNGDAHERPGWSGLRDVIPSVATFPHARKCPEYNSSDPACHRRGSIALVAKYLAHVKSGQQNQRSCHVFSREVEHLASGCTGRLAPCHRTRYQAWRLQPVRLRAEGACGASKQRTSRRTCCCGTHGTLPGSRRGRALHAQAPGSQPGEREPNGPCVTPVPPQRVSL